MRRDIKHIISLRTLAYLRYVLPIVFIVRNWIPFLFDYVGVTNKARIYALRNGLKIKTGDGISSGTIAVIFVKKDYGNPPGKNSTIIDIGANIGVYTLYAAQSEGVKVYAFEPMPDNFQLLKKNIAMNNLEGRVFPFQYAVSGEKEHRKLYIGASPLHSFLPMDKSPFHAKFEHPEAQESIEVPCTSLREIFDEHNIKTCDILKLDCEGAEYDILYSLPQEYFQRIKHIRMEYHNHHNNSKNTGEPLIKFLQQQGFTLKKLKKGSEHQGDVWLDRKT